MNGHPFGPFLLYARRECPSNVPYKFKSRLRRAEKLLLDPRKSFVPPVVSKENEDISSDMLFADYMELWLEIIRSSVERPPFPLTHRW